MHAVVKLMLRQSRMPRFLVLSAGKEGLKVSNLLSVGTPEAILVPQAALLFYCLH